MSNLPSLADCTTLLRGAPNRYARAALRNQLARAVRGCCLDMLVLRGVPAAAAEDYTNDLTFDLVCRIERGDVTPGREEPYVKQCARNRARDHFRKESGVVSRFALEEDIEMVPTDSSPEALMLDLERDAETQRLTEQVHVWLEQAPPRYREYLEAVYLRGKAIEELVAREVERRAPEQPGDELVHRRARAVVDKVLERARAWVRGKAVAGGRR